MSTLDLTPKAAQKKNTAEQRLKQCQHAATLIKQASNLTRLRVLLILSEGENHVSALCKTVGQSQANASHHLAMLRHGGIIAPRRSGQNIFYTLTKMGEDLTKAVKGVVH